MAPRQYGPISQSWHSGRPHTLVVLTTHPFPCGTPHRPCPGGSGRRCQRLWALGGAAVHHLQTCRPRRTRIWANQTRRPGKQAILAQSTAGTHSGTDSAPIVSVATTTTTPDRDTKEDASFCLPGHVLALQVPILAALTDVNLSAIAVGPLVAPRVGSRDEDYRVVRYQLQQLEQCRLGHSVPRRSGLAHRVGQHGVDLGLHLHAPTAVLLMLLTPHRGLVATRQAPHAGRQLAIGEVQGAVMKRVLGTALATHSLLLPLISRSTAASMSAALKPLARRRLRPCFPTRILCASFWGGA